MRGRIRSQRTEKKASSSLLSSAANVSSSISLCDRAAVSSDVLLPTILDHLSGDEACRTTQTPEQRMLLQQSLQRWRSVFMVWRKVLDCDALFLTLLLHAGCLWSTNYERVFPIFQRQLRAIVPHSEDPTSRSSPLTEDRVKWCNLMDAMDKVYPFDMWALAVTHFLSLVEIFSVERGIHDGMTSEFGTADMAASRSEGMQGGSFHRLETSSTPPLPTPTTTTTRKRGRKRQRVSLVDGRLRSSSKIQSVNRATGLTVHQIDTEDEDEDEDEEGKEEEEKRRGSPLDTAAARASSLHGRRAFHSTNEFFPDELWPSSKSSSGYASPTTSERGRRGFQKGWRDATDSPLSSTFSSLWWLCTIAGDNDVEQQRVGSFLVDRWFELMDHPYLLSTGKPQENCQSAEEVVVRDESRHLWFASAIKFAAFVDGVDCPLVEENAHITSVVARCGREWSTIATLLYRSIPSIFLCLLEQEVVLDKGGSVKHPSSSESSAPPSQTGNTSTSKEGTTGGEINRMTTEKMTASPRLWLPPLILLMPFHLCGQGSCVSLMKTPYVIQKLLHKENTSGGSTTAAVHHNHGKSSAPLSSFRTRGVIGGAGHYGAPAHPTLLKRTSQHTAGSARAGWRSSSAVGKIGTEPSGVGGRTARHPMPLTSSSALSLSEGGNEENAETEREQEEMEARTMLAESKVAHMWVRGMFVTSHGFVVHHPPLSAENSLLKEECRLVEEKIDDDDEELSEDQFGLGLRFTRPRNATDAGSAHSTSSLFDKTHKTVPTSLAATSIGRYAITGEYQRRAGRRPSRPVGYYDPFVNPPDEAQLGPRYTSSSLSLGHNSQVHNPGLRAAPRVLPGEKEKNTSLSSWQGNAVKIGFLRVEEHLERTRNAEEDEVGGRGAAKLEEDVGTQTGGLHPRLLLLKPIPRHASANDKNNGTPSTSSSLSSSATASSAASLVYPYTLLYSESVSASASTTIEGIEWFKALYPGVEVEGVPESVKTASGGRKPAPLHGSSSARLGTGGLPKSSMSSVGLTTTSDLYATPSQSPHGRVDHDSVLRGRVGRRRGRRPRGYTESNAPLDSRGSGLTSSRITSSSTGTAVASLTASDSWIHCCFSRDPCAHFLQSLFRMARRALSMRGVALASTDSPVFPLDSFSAENCSVVPDASQNHTTTHLSTLSSSTSQSSADGALLRFQWHNFLDPAHELIALLQMAHTFALLPLVLATTANWIRFPSSPAASTFASTTEDPEDMLLVPLWLTHATSFLTDLSVHVPRSVSTNAVALVRHLFYGAGMALGLHPKTSEMTLVAVGWVSQVVRRDRQERAECGREEAATAEAMVQGVNNGVPIPWWSLFLYNTVYQSREENSSLDHSYPPRKVDDFSTKLGTLQMDNENWLPCCLTRGIQLLIKKARMEMLPRDYADAQTSTEETIMQASDPRFLPSTDNMISGQDEARTLGVLEKWSRQRKNNGTIGKVEYSLTEGIDSVKQGASFFDTTNRNSKTESISTSKLVCQNVLCGEAVVRYKDRPPQFLFR